MYTVLYSYAFFRRTATNTFNYSMSVTLNEKCVNVENLKPKIKTKKYDIFHDFSKIQFLTYCNNFKNSIEKYN